MEHTGSLQGSQQPNTCTYPEPDQSSEPTSLTYIVTCFLTPRSRDLFEKLTGSQLVKKFPAFYWTRRFITASTTVRHLSLCWTSSIQYMPPYPTSWGCILLSSHLRLGLPSGLFPSGFRTKTLYAPLLYPIRATCPANLTLLNLINRLKSGEEYKSLSSSLCSFLHSPVTSSLLGQNILLSTIFSNTLSLFSVLSVTDQFPHCRYSQWNKLSTWNSHHKQRIFVKNSGTCCVYVTR